MKRLFDFIVSLTALTIFSLPMLIVAIIVKVKRNLRLSLHKIDRVIIANHFTSIDIEQ